MLSQKEQPYAGVNYRSIWSADSALRAFFGVAVVFPNFLGTIAVIFAVIRSFFFCIALPTNRVRLLLSLALAFYALLHGILFVFQGEEVSNPEIKLLPILIGIASLGLVRDLAPNYNFQILMFRLLSAFTIIGVVLSFLSSGALFRFPDYLPIKFGFISIYYGSVCLLFLALEDDRRKSLLYFSYILLSGSGTVILGAACVFAYRFRRVKFVRKVIITVGALLLLSVLQVTQEQRGRDLSNLDTLDRFAIQAGYVNWLQDVASPSQILLGCGIACDMENMPSYIGMAAFRDYLVSESDGLVSGRNLHSDHFRLFNHFGLLGWGLVVFTLYRILHRKKELFWATMAMCMLNSILTSSPFFIALLATLRPER